MSTIQHPRTSRRKTCCRGAARKRDWGRSRLSCTVSRIPAHHTSVPSQSICGCAPGAWFASVMPYEGRWSIAASQLDSRAIPLRCRCPQSDGAVRTRNAVVPERSRHRYVRPMAHGLGADDALSGRFVFATAVCLTCFTHRCERLLQGCLAPLERELVSRLPAVIVAAAADTLSQHT